MGKEILGSLELDRIYQFNCVDGMKLLPDECVDLTVTSPPYDGLRTYNGYSFDFESVAKELYRVTKNGGVVVWVVGDATIKGSETGTSFKQALHFKEIGFNLHDTMIYEKEAPPPLKSIRYQPCFEYMFVFSKGKLTTFNPLLDVCKDSGRIIFNTQRNANGETKAFTGNGRAVKQNKTRRNIWRYDVGFMRTTKDAEAFKHPAMFPEKLAEDHILSWTNKGDIVLDCFMGSGTTAKMASVNDRKWIGFELSREYIEIANMRLDNLEEET